MKLQGAWLCFAGLMSVATVGLIRLRRKEEAQEAQAVQFQVVKLRVTSDLLAEYQHEMIHMHSLLDKTHAHVKEITLELGNRQAAQESKKAEVETCQGETKHLTDQEASTATEDARIKAEFDQEKGRWEAEMASLKQQAAGRSKVCDFVKASAISKKFCGDEVNKEEAAKKKPKEKVKPVPKADEVAEGAEDQEKNGQ